VQLHRASLPGQTDIMTVALLCFLMVFHANHITLTTPRPTPFHPNHSVLPLATPRPTPFHPNHSVLPLATPRPTPFHPNHSVLPLTTPRPTPFHPNHSVLPLATPRPTPSTSFPIYYSNIVTLFQHKDNLRNQKFSLGGGADRTAEGLRNLFSILQNRV
jgi:hypothetical protein